MTIKTGDKVRVERIEPIGPNGVGEGTVREMSDFICIQCTVDFTSLDGKTDVYVKRDGDDDIWYQWGSRDSLWKITKL